MKACFPSTLLNGNCPTLSTKKKISLLLVSQPSENDLNSKHTYN